MNPFPWFCGLLNRVRLNVIVLSLTLLALLAATIGCSNDPYPMPDNGSGARANAHAEVGEPSPLVVLHLYPKPGDQIEFLGAEPVGEVEGADVRFFLSRPVFKPNGDIVIGEQREPLAGAVVLNESEMSGFAHAVGIIAEMEAHEPGQFQLTNVRLRYRLNGGSVRVGEGIDVTYTLCADNPAPTTCEG